MVRVFDESALPRGDYRYASPFGREGLGSEACAGSGGSPRCEIVDHVGDQPGAARGARDELLP